MKTVHFSETIAASDLRQMDKMKICEYGRCRSLRRYVSIEGQGHIFTIYFPGFVCFVLY